MKKLYKNLRNSLLFCSLLASMGLHAQSVVAVVSNVRGDAFVTHNNRTVALKSGQHLYDFSEITTSIGAQVSLNDYFDHRYHLAGGGHIKLSKRTIELVRGYFWVQTLGNQNQGFTIQTANAVLNQAPGEGILAFDTATNRTDFLSLKGFFTFRNLQDPNYVTQVKEGQFSFIASAEDIAPRNPTPVGKNSLTQIFSLFEEVKGLDNVAMPGSSLKEMVSTTGSQVSRAPASADMPAKRSSPMGHVIFLPLERNPELVKDREGLIESYRDKKSERNTRPSRAPARAEPKKETPIQVRVFGAPQMNKPTPSRAPASVKPTAVEEMVKVKRAPASVKQQTDAFESSLVDQYKKQMRHSDEVNQLIRDLKNYEMDYDTGY